MARWLVHQKDRTESPLVQWLEARGCRYHAIGQPVDGLLDVPTPRGHVTVPVEWKTRQGALRKSQKAFLAKWRAPVYVIRTELEAAAMLAEIQR